MMSRNLSSPDLPVCTEAGDASREGARLDAARLRFDGFDIARGLSILLVVVMHSTLGVEHRLGHSGAFRGIVDFATAFRVPTFFFLSGLFIAGRLDEPFARFLGRRIIGLGVIYVLWLIIHLGLRAAPEIVRNPVEMLLGPTGLFAEIGMGLIEPFGALWFIHLLVIFFVVAWLTRHVPWPVLIAIGVALESLRLQTAWTMPDEFTARYLYFAAGVALARHFPVRQEVAPLWAHFRKWATSRSGLVFLALWAPVHGLAVSQGLDKVLGLSLLAGFSGIVAMMVAGFRIADLAEEAPLRRFLSLCGRRSIVIYLVFTIPMAAARGALISLLPIGTRLAPMSVDAIVAGTVLCAILGALLVERFSRRGPLRLLFERPRFG